MEGKSGVQEARIIPGVDGKLIYGFPKAIITKLRYCTNISQVSTLGSSAVHVFSANSIFDPDVTGVGHQPLYRDQYAAIYENYVVLGSKITVTWTNPFTNQFITGISADNDSFIPTNTDNRMEMSNSVSSVLVATGGLNVLSMSYSPTEDLGVDVTSDGYSQTPVGSSPTDQWYYGVTAFTMDATTSTCYAKIEIEYTVKFSELITPTGS